MIARIKLFFAVVGSFILMGLTTWLSLKRAAAAEQKAKQVENRIEVIHRAQEIENEVEALDIDDLKRRSTKWVRGK
jgi:hypothetical protein